MENCQNMIYCAACVTRVRSVYLPYQNHCTKYIYQKFGTPKIVTITIPKVLVFQKISWYDMVMVHYPNTHHLFYPISNQKFKIKN